MFLALPNVGVCVVELSIVYRPLLARFLEYSYELTYHIGRQETSNFQVESFSLFIRSSF